MAPLEEYHKTSKQISRMRKDTYNSLVHPPLPKPDRERLERKTARGLVDEEFSKWVHLVKRNREAPTVYFSQEVVNLGKSTVGAIASEFQPRTEFEMRMASVLNDKEVSEAHREDGARLLELNQASSVIYFIPCSNGFAGQPPRTCITPKQIFYIRTCLAKARDNPSNLCLILIILILFKKN